MRVKSFSISFLLAQLVISCLRNAQKILVCVCVLRVLPVNKGVQITSSGVFECGLKRNRKQSEKLDNFEACTSVLSAARIFGKSYR